MRPSSPVAHTDLSRWPPNRPLPPSLDSECTRLSHVALCPAGRSGSRAPAVQEGLDGRDVAAATNETGSGVVFAPRRAGPAALSRSPRVEVRSPSDDPAVPLLLIRCAGASAPVSRGRPPGAGDRRAQRRNASGAPLVATRREAPGRQAVLRVVRPVVRPEIGPRPGGLATGALPLQAATSTPRREGQRVQDALSPMTLTGHYATRGR